jgi:hypothetical protein
MSNLKIFTDLALVHPGCIILGGVKSIVGFDLAIDFDLSLILGVH